ncbi:MAG: glutathione S-transferase family protein [Solirubrobacteraceae bacterium]
MKLYMFPGSNAVYTARLMLEHKGIEYVNVKLPPGLHTFALLALGFQTMAVPALKTDGQRVQGTRSISRFLDELEPERPLFPAEPARRAAVQEAERWGEELQNATRRVFYCAARRDPAAFASVMSTDWGMPMRLVLRMLAPVIVRLASGMHRASDDAGREDLALLPARLTQVDRWIEQGLLNGRELNAADFQIAPNISALLLFEDLLPFIAGRPAEALARRVAPDYVGHLGHLLPGEWLAPLQRRGDGDTG